MTTSFAESPNPVDMTVESSTTASPQTVLVVDDDQAFRELMVLALELHGLRAIGARNIFEGRKILQTHIVDLLLLDLRLGSDDGIELLRETRVRRSEKIVPVLILTACSDRASIMEIATLNVQGYLLKRELSRTDLLARVDQHLRRDCGNQEIHVESGALVGAGGPNVDQLVQDDRSGEPTQCAPVVAADVGAVVPEPIAPLQPVSTREAMQEAVDRAGTLKAWSPTVSQLLNMTNESDCSLEQISRVVKRDPAIALKLLKMANSVVYSRGGAVDTVQKALSRIGLAQVRQLVSNIAVVSNLHLREFGDSFNCRLFWEHSIATGLIAAAITRNRNGSDRELDAAFTCGLLHDIARLIFADQLGEKYRQVMEAAAIRGLPLELAELQMLQCDHAGLMERLLTAWSFPKHLVEPIAMHHNSIEDIRSLPPAIMQSVATLSLANRLAHCMLLGSSGDECLLSTVELCQLLELDSAAMTFIEERIPEETNDVKTVLLQNGPDNGWPDYSRIAKERLKYQIRPLFLGKNAPIDGFRILFDRLASGPRDGKANLAIAHSIDEHDVQLQAESLAATERQLGILPLPLLVISNRPYLELRKLEARTQDVLKCPFTYSQLASSINHLLLPPSTR